jgi:hypothetical protein
MKKATALSIVLALLAATPALARHHHVQSNAQGYSHIDSGFGPPRNWSEIEQSSGSGGF